MSSTYYMQGNKTVKHVTRQIEMKTDNLKRKIYDNKSAKENGEEKTESNNRRREKRTILIRITQVGGCHTCICIVVQ